MSAIGAESALSGTATPERGVLLLWMVLSLGLLLVTLVVEAIRHQRAPRFTDSP